MSELNGKCSRPVAEDAKKLESAADAYLHANQSEEQGAFEKFFDQLHSIRSGGIGCVDEVFRHIKQEHGGSADKPLYLPELGIGVNDKDHVIVFSTSESERSAGNKRSISAVFGEGLGAMNNQTVVGHAYGLESATYDRAEFVHEPGKGKRSDK